MRLPQKIELKSTVSQSNKYTSNDQNQGEAKESEEIIDKNTQMRKSLEGNRIRHSGNQGSFLGTLLNYGGAAVGFDLEDDAARRAHQRIVAERKGHSRVYPYFKLDNPIMYQSSNYNLRPSTSGGQEVSGGGILLGSGEIEQNDDAFSYSTSKKSHKSSTGRVSTAGKSIKSRRQLSILGKDGKLSSASRKSHTRPLD